MPDAPFPAAMMPCIADFFRDVHRSLKPGLNVYPQVFSTSLFFPLQRQRELERMMKLARSYEPRVVYEIGTDKGGGLYHWCMGLRSVRRVIACEIRGTPYKHLFEAAFPHIDFLWLDGVSSFSPDTVSRVEHWLDADAIDVLFIDGDKSAFRLDFDSYSFMMAHPSLVLMHDVQDFPPKDAFFALTEDHRHKVILDTSEGDEAAHRARNGMPCGSAYEGWLRYWKGRSCGVGCLFID